jgi:hypothetical protein
VIIWAQANAALVDASGGVSASTILSIALGAVGVAGTVIGILWKLDRAQLTSTIAKQDAELLKLNDRLKFSAQKIDAMVADSIGLHSELARERALREAREFVPRDSGSSPGRTPTNPSMMAVPLPLPPPKSKS